MAAGDAVFVPAGAPHAIGAGILMVEVQEPTDLSVLLEWDGFELTEDEGHLDLGWDTALQALDRSVWDEPRVGRAARPGRGPLAAAARGRPVVPGRAGARRRRARRGLLDPRRALRATASLGGEPFGRGTALLVPFATGPLTLAGDVEAIRCRPPDPAVAA